MVSLGKPSLRSNQGVEVEEAQSCVLCLGDGVELYKSLNDRLFSSPGTWELLRCLNCGLAWVNPRPIPAGISKLYADYYTHNIVKGASHPSGLWAGVSNAILAGRLGYHGLVSGSLREQMGLVLSWVGPIREMVELSVMTLAAPAKGALLDVGCGNGEFLARMRDLGWEVAGLEPDKAAVRVARERFGLCVREGTISETGFPEDAFDAITINHVIEHLCDPVGTLRECSRLLKPGGKLVVATPNIQSLGHLVFREFWRGLEVPRHVYLFSPDSLRTCCERAGLRVLKIRTTARSAHKMYTCSYLVWRNGSLSGGMPAKVEFGVRLSGLLFHAVEHGLSWFKSAGEELVLIATRDKE